MTKSEVIEILGQMAILLDFKGENFFKIRAYQNAARILENLSVDLKQLMEDGTLLDTPGIGKGIYQVISDLYQKGKSSEFEQLKKSFPATLFELFHIPGLGAKRIKILYEKLGIKSLKELEAACLKTKLQTLEGFGPKTQEVILKGIEQLKKNSGIFNLNEADEEAQRILEYLKKNKAVKKIEIAGSLRRMKEIIRDIDLVTATDKPKAVHQWLLDYPQVSRVLGQGETKTSVLLQSGIQVDLRTVSEKEFPYALLYFTGSKEHSIEVRGIAQSKKLKLNEYGLWRGKKQLACKSEEAIYETLGLHYVPPEARENCGEVEWVKEKPLPRFVEEKDIRGVFHVHSNYTDGVDTLGAMIAEAEAMSYEYVGISDHSQSAVYANGMKPDRVMKQWKELDRLQKKFKIRIFKGIESDILGDGSLDYSEDILSQFDFIIGSIHSRFKMNEDKMTDRLMRAMDNRHVTFIGHPTGRRLLNREGYQVNFKKLFDHSKKSGVILELNADPYRLDLDWRVSRRAKEEKLELSIHPDAHSVSGMHKTRYGVGMARKAWLEKKDIINTKTLSEIEKFLKKRK